jgi:hypothetical protein
LKVNAIIPNSGEQEAVEEEWHHHEIKGVTSFVEGHNHRFIGVTSEGTSYKDHVHVYYAYTSLNHGHRHLMTGMTGKAIYLSDGTHYHEYEAFTIMSIEPEHIHLFGGKTK